MCTLSNKAISFYRLNSLYVTEVFTVYDASVSCHSKTIDAAIALGSLHGILEDKELINSPLSH